MTTPRMMDYTLAPDDPIGQLDLGPFGRADPTKQPEKVYFSSNRGNSEDDWLKDEWETPPSIWTPLNDRFGFTLDPCATDANHLTPHYYTAEQDGLAQSWQGHTVFINPPYSNWQPWVRKAQEEVSNQSKPTTVVALIAARTDTAIWHQCVMPYAAEVHFVRGRVVFRRPPAAGEKPTVSAPFPSAIVVFTGQLPTRYSSWQQPKRSRSLTSGPSGFATPRRPRSTKSASVAAVTSPNTVPRS